MLQILLALNKMNIKMFHDMVVQFHFMLKVICWNNIEDQLELFNFEFSLPQFKLFNFILD